MKCPDCLSWKQVVTPIPEGKFYSCSECGLAFGVSVELAREWHRYGDGFQQNAIALASKRANPPTVTADDMDAVGARMNPTAGSG